MIGYTFQTPFHNFGQIWSGLQRVNIISEIKDNGWMNVKLITTIFLKTHCGNERFYILQTELKTPESGEEKYVLIYCWEEFASAYYIVYSIRP